MKPCLKAIQVISLFIMAFAFSEGVYAQKEKGYCDDWCGRKGNDAWNAVMAKYGLPIGAPGTSQDPYRAEADAAKKNAEEKCKADTAGKTRAQCDGQSSASTVPTPSANPNRCVAEYTELAKQCESSTSSAVSSCDENSSSAFSSSSAGTTESTSGVTDSCKAAGSLSTSAKDAWTTFKNFCEAGSNSCYSACSDVESWAKSNSTCFPLTVDGKTYNSADSLKSSGYGQTWDTCIELASQVQKAEENIKAYANNATTADNCTTSTAGGDSKNNNTGNTLTSLASMLGQALNGQSASSTEVASELTTFCQTNPSYPGCSSASAVNCSDPSMATTNKICICAANPAACRSAQADNSQIMASIDSSSRLPSSNDDSLGDIPDSPGIMPGTPSPGGGEAIDGSQGGAPVGSANVGSGGAGNYKNATVNDDPLATGGGGGTFGGSGGMFRSNTGGSGGGSYGSRAGTNTNDPNKPGGGPDLRQFLPGGAYAPRGNAIGGKVGIDGITGPNSNIWQKVQNRYRVLQDTLHP